MSIIIKEMTEKLNVRNRGSLRLRWRLGLLKGNMYRILWVVGRVWGGPSVSAGAGLSVQGRLRIRGGGRVEIGSDVVVDNRTDLYTHSREARIRIGSGSFLNGTRMGAQKEISVGERCILADARIMDTDFHSLSENRWSKDAPIAVSPVVIEANVWIAAGAAVLKGVKIGKNSVVGFGSVVTSDIPSGVVAAGNPARVISNLPSG